MKLIIYFTLFVGLIVNQLHGQDLNESHKAAIKQVITTIKSSDVDKIVSIINYPLKREYPIPPIRDKSIMKQRFKQVFDDTLIRTIANSKMEQWSEVGWRGIMLDAGTIWMDNSDGVITAINYQSEVEKRLWKDLVAKDKANLHATLKTYKTPIYKIKTKQYLIRIDQLANNKFRYASWKLGYKESTKPDIVLYAADNGYEMSGTGGNQSYTFRNKNYTYIIYRTIMGEANDSEFSLVVEQNGKEILNQQAELIYP